MATPNHGNPSPRAGGIQNVDGLLGALDEACTTSVPRASSVHAAEVDELLALFSYDQRDNLARTYALLAARIRAVAPDQYQTLTALQRLLESKDAAVRAARVAESRHPDAWQKDESSRGAREQNAKAIAARVVEPSVSWARWIWAVPRHPRKGWRPRADDSLGLTFCYCSRCGYLARGPLDADGVRLLDHPPSRVNLPHSEGDCLLALRQRLDGLRSFVTDNHVDEWGLEELDEVRP